MCMFHLVLPALVGACPCLQAPGCCNGSVPLGCRLQAAARVISEAVSSAGVFATPKAAAYWTYHLSRSSFFLLQGAAGEELAAHTHASSFFLLQGAANELLLRASPGCPGTCNPSTRV